MICRIWRAAASPEGAKAYRAHVSQVVLPHLRRLAGFSGAYVLEREQDGEVELQVMTLWGTLEAIRAFAGSDIGTAIVEPEARAVLARYDRTVSHHTVVITAAAG